MRRQFYRVCDQVINELKDDDSKVIYADKSKMFDNVLENKIPYHKWNGTIRCLCKDSKNNWAYSETGKRAFEN